MGRRSSGKSRERVRDPHVIIPSGRSYYYVAGTLQTSEGRIRLTGSTGVRIDEPDAEERAKAWLYEDLIPRLLKKARTGIEEIPFSTAALTWVREKYPRGMMSKAPDPKTGERRPTNSDERIVLELAKHFKTKDIHRINASAIDLYYSERFNGSQSAATVRRHQNTLIAIFNRHSVPLPEFRRPKEPNRKGHAAGKKLETNEVALLVECFVPRLRPLIWLYFLTGARTSELLFLDRQHFPGAKKVILPDTKSGEADVIDLPAWYTEILIEHLKTHTLQRVFLTHRGRPYTRRPGGGQAGFRKELYNARKAAAKILRESGRPDRAMIMEKVTIHWGRHTAANTMLDQGVPTIVVRKALRWASDAVLNEHYLAEKRHLVKEAMAALPFMPQNGTLDANKTQQESEGQGSV